jgi:hypothetical protein
MDPMTGFTVPVPQPYVLAKRVPEDLPYVLRPQVRLVVFRLGLPYLLVLLLFTCGLVGRQPDASTELLVVWLAFAAFLGVLSVATIALRLTGGPLLGLHEHGVWVRTRRSPGQAIWLPWPTIEYVQRRRGRRGYLVIRPRDLRLGGLRLGAWTRISLVNQETFLGPGFVVLPGFAGERAETVLGAMAHYSGLSGKRVPIV